MKPCIRGLKKFKSGCPESSECPAWIETLGRLHPVHIKKCADIATVDLLWDLNCNINGVQAASEGTRNMMACLSLVAAGNKNKIHELSRVAEKHLLVNENA